MVFLISPNAYKGTLSPFEAARIIDQTLRLYLPKIKTTILPLADGGDGTLDVLSHVFHAKKITTSVTGPLGKKVKASWAYVSARRGKKPFAVIEMARASGLALIKGKKNILKSTSFGTGELIKAALNKGARTIFIGVGGTATADGGAGALEALGLKYFDKDGRPLHGHPQDLAKVASIDWRLLDNRLKKTKVFVLCDVRNPLLGPSGSARTFAPQKGATKKDVLFLEKLMKQWSTFARIQTRNSPGAGAAGATAFGLSAFAGAKLVAGTPFIMKQVNWFNAARRADAIITGEGKLDKTSFSGKVVGAILKNTRQKPVYVICGQSSLPTSHVEKAKIAALIQMGRAGLKNPTASLTRAVKKLITCLPCPN